MQVLIVPYDAHLPKYGSLQVGKKISPALSKTKKPIQFLHRSVNLGNIA